MRILTLAMQVPDSRATITVAPDGSRLEPKGLKLVCNPFDEFAIEQAIRLKESRTDVTEVVTLTVGPPDAVGVLRTALAMGCDRGIHVCADDLPGHDELIIASIAAAAIGRDDAGFELILCGKQAIDNDSGELGPALAELLDLPHIGAVCRLELAEDAGGLRARRRIEGAEEIVEAPLPCLLTCEKGLVEPRYPSLPNIMKAKKKPVETVAVTDLAPPDALVPGTALVGLAPPPPRPPCTMIDGEPHEMARELVRRLREEAKVI
jgi:electron transfer flavoprotein beta subunit